MTSFTEYSGYGQKYNIIPRHFQSVPKCIGLPTPQFQSEWRVALSAPFYYTGTHTGIQTTECD